jgi:hypothetical protein
MLANNKKEIDNMVFTADEKYSMQNEFSKENSGYILIANALTRCLFLNSSAKFIYTLLATYCYGDKRDCYPTMEELAFLSDRTEKWVGEYISVLEKAELLTVRKTKYGNNLYIFNEIHKSKVILHSEAVHLAMYRLKAEGIPLEDQFDTFDKYKNSELCKEMSNCDDPLADTDRIYDYFCKDMGIQNKDKPERFMSVFVLDKRLIWEIEQLIEFYYECCEAKHGDKCQTDKDFEFAVITWKHVYSGHEKNMADDLSAYINSKSKEECSFEDFYKYSSSKYLDEDTIRSMADWYKF